MSIQAGEHIPEAILQYIDGGVPNTCKSSARSG